MSTKKVEIKQIADKFGIHPSNLRKRLLKDGYRLTKQRVCTRRSQFCLHLTAKDAIKVTAQLKKEGYAVKS